MHRTMKKYAMKAANGLRGGQEKFLLDWYVADEGKNSQKA